MLSEQEFIILLAFARLIDSHALPRSRVDQASCLEDIEDIAHIYGHNEVSCRLLEALGCHMYSCDWIWQDIDRNWSVHIYLLALAIKIQALIPGKDRIDLSQLATSCTDNSDRTDCYNQEPEIARREINLLKTSPELTAHSTGMKLNSTKINRWPTDENRDRV